MSGVRAAQQLKEPSPDADLETMQDILYEMMEDGVDLDAAKVTHQQVEEFLHEHARSPKTVEEFTAFFDKAGLAKQPLQTTPKLEVVPPPLPAPALRVDTQEIEILAEDDLSPEVDTTSRPLPPPPRRSQAPFLWVAVATLLLGFAALGLYGYESLTRLRAELEHTRTLGAQNSLTIGALEDRAATLQSSVAANGQVIHDVDLKSDLLLRSVSPEGASDKGGKRSKR